MNIRFTIGKKIGTGFGVLIMLTLIVFATTYVVLQDSRSINDRINRVNNPSVKTLQELKFAILESKLFLESWVKYPKDHPDKTRLNDFRESEYDELKATLMVLSQEWSGGQRDTLNTAFETIDELFVWQDEIRNNLNSFESYNNEGLQLLADFSLEEGGEVYELTKIVLAQLNSLIQVKKTNSASASKSMVAAFQRLQNVVIYLGIALIVMGILIALYTTRTIVRPVSRLKNTLIKLGKGVFPRHKLKVGNDEIGEMTEAMNNVVDGLIRTKDFAKEVGSGNFETDYKPLSQKDTLGKALLKMRDDLHENERILEEKVKLRTAEVVQQKEELEKQRLQIEEYFMQVTDSIRYAKRIQEAILPPESFVRKLLPDSFILYRPKDIVSGDFYWMDRTREKVFFAAVDCTGHGVPGAFMSIVGFNNLKQALNTTKGSSPAAILNELNKGVSETLHQKEENSTSKDGMDIAICSLNHKTLELEYAGAFNPLYLLRNDEIIQVKGDKFPIGSFIQGETQEFTNNKLQLEKGDQVYIFSDGYADQFGGPRGKKFMYKQFRDTLIKYSKHDLSEQKDRLRERLFEWMGQEEQVDDILVIGVRV